jgi:hypothetical protein
VEAVEKLAGSWLQVHEEAVRKLAGWKLSGSLQEACSKWVVEAVRKLAGWKL